MREKRSVQSSVFEIYAEHEIGKELEGISDWLDENPDLLARVEADVCNRNVEETGRKGLPVESVLRCALLKQYRQISYEELVFCLIDSATCQAFARLPMGWFPKKTTLQQSISVISAVTWEAINTRLLERAQQAKVEKGEMLRIDSTVTETPIHKPTDSSLLLDAVRVIVRLLKEANELAGETTRIAYQNHHRRAKKRARAIEYTRGQAKKAQLYKDLIHVTRKSLCYLEDAAGILKAVQPLASALWQTQVAEFKPLIGQVIDQTERRLFHGETVPADEKLFSLFEAHTAIIIKGSRAIQYGHKLNLSTGRSGLILDVVVEAGNPADTERFIPMLERHIEHYGKAPRQMAADGGYASRENLAHAKACQVEDVVFQKKRGLKVEEMAKSPWVYRKLRNFRAGIEAGISCLKRAYGLARCTWKSLPHFKAYVWSSVVAHNLALFARLRPA